MIFILTGLLYETVSVFGSMFILEYLSEKYKSKKPIWYDHIVRRFIRYITIECHIIASLFIIIGVYIK